MTQLAEMIPLVAAMLGGQELLILFLIIIVLFGAKRIPELAKGLGQGVRGFRTAVRGDEESEGGEIQKTES